MKTLKRKRNLSKSQKNCMQKGKYSFVLNMDGIFVHFQILKSIYIYQFIALQKKIGTKEQMKNKKAHKKLEIYSLK